MMKDGTMFNNLHKFKDKEKFKKSNLILETKNGKEVFKPLGMYTSNTDFFYNELDNYSIDEAIDFIKGKSIFETNVEYSENSHILTLITCDYSQKDNRLILFFISK